MLHIRNELEADTISAASQACSECWTIAGSWRGLDDCRQRVREVGGRLKKILDPNERTYRGEVITSRNDQPPSQLAFRPTSLCTLISSPPFIKNQDSLIQLHLLEQAFLLFFFGQLTCTLYPQISVDSSVALQCCHIHHGPEAKHLTSVSSQQICLIKLTMRNQPCGIHAS